MTEPASSSLHHLSEAAAEARRQFPRGLHQPEGGFRFGSDSLLLACFAKLHKVGHILDLGTGCGVIAAALLLKDENVQALGIDKDPAMAAAAQKNAELLGLTGRLKVVDGDIADYHSLQQIEGNGFDLVVTNPPYRRLDSGRPSSSRREPALAEDEAGLRTFADAAAYALANLKPCCVVLPADRTVELLSISQEAGLTPKRMRFVHSRAEEAARLVLIEAVKNGGPGCTVEPPLILYEGTGEATTPTREALRFCPYF